MTERCTRRIQLRSEVFVATGADGRVALLQSARWGEQFGKLTEAEKAMLHELAAGERAELELLARFGARDSLLLRRLHAGGWLTVHYGHGGRPLITVRPLGPHREPRPSGPPAAPRLSRFAVLHRESGGLALESPLCRAVVLLRDPRVLTIVHHLAGAGGPLPDTGLPRAIVDELLGELVWYGFVHEADEDVRPNLATEQWGAHELWFHARSRGGFHDYPFGSTKWAVEKYPPLPARREPWSGTAIRLATPEGGQPRPLGEVLEARRSIRTPDDATPLTVAQLGEFLHWSARVRRSGMDDTHEISLRPSPSGGAMHGIEVYPIVTNVTGLAPGMYHYDPFAHVLEPVQAGEFAVLQLVRRAAAAAGDAPTPQVLLIFAARFGRPLWKYQSMGYALVLKDAGALIQTMYLVATAMNLAPCALGSGDSDLFAQATGLNPLTESSVAEFMLSSRGS